MASLIVGELVSEEAVMSFIIRISLDLSMFSIIILIENKVIIYRCSPGRSASPLPHNAISNAQRERILNHGKRKEKS